MKKYIIKAVYIAGYKGKQLKKGEEYPEADFYADHIAGLLQDGAIEEKLEEKAAKKVVDEKKA